MIRAARLVFTQGTLFTEQWNLSLVLTLAQFDTGHQERPFLCYLKNLMKLLPYILTID